MCLHLETESFGSLYVWRIPEVVAERMVRRPGWIVAMRAPSGDGTECCAAQRDVSHVYNLKVSTYKICSSREPCWASLGGSDGGMKQLSQSGRRINRAEASRASVILNTLDETLQLSES